MKIKIFLILLSAFIIFGFKRNREEKQKRSNAFDDKTTGIWLVNYVYSPLYLYD